MALFCIERQPWQHWPKVVMVRKKVDGAERDERRRYVPERACEDANTRFNAWTCSECKATLLLMFDDYGEPTYSVDGVADIPNYCPNCGARVKEER